MINEAYFRQVQLLLQVLSQVAREPAFALKGGTAINLFVRDLPRLSVDIDLTYLPIVDRATDLRAIGESLGRIKEYLQSLSPRIEATITSQADGVQAKLICRQGVTQIKVEVNTVFRGSLQAPRTMRVLEKVEEEFGLFSANQVLSQGELYGGKLCAALDRQHPRDLFDVAVLFEKEGINNDIKLGFIAALLSHGRPMYELLQPVFKDQKAAFAKQFSGMAYKSFSYDDYERTRQQLANIIRAILADEDRQFIIGFKSGNPDWSLFPWPGIENMPAVQWKLKNIKQLIVHNPSKHASQLLALQRCLQNDS